jgi:RNA polymerase sigma factor (sigma-70 family)
MPEQQDLEPLLVQNLAWIDRATASLCRRHGLFGDDADDFASWAKMKLLDKDYAVLRKFRGESSITTFLTVVLSRLFRDYRVSQRGRWRPSAAAKRLGPVAVRLETLVRRDRLRFGQAVEALRSRGETNQSERELSTLMAGVLADVRGRPQVMPEESLAAIPSPDSPERPLEESEAEVQRAAVRLAVARAVEGLSDEDRVILRLRFVKDSKISDIARALGLDQKPLYRRLDRLLETLRGELESSGISREQVYELLYGDAT